MKYSIVIPTYNHCEDYLKPCIDSILKYSDLTDLEVIVVANGCTDGTKEYLGQLIGPWLKVIWRDAPLGYPLANNLGISVASGDYIILLNNDTQLQPQERNYWLDLLTSPFEKDAKVGITGPVKFDWDCGGYTYQCMAFWLVCIKRSLIEAIGGLDEAFSPGMGEDGDFCIRAAVNGVTFVSVPQDSVDSFGNKITNMGFPINHIGNGTFRDNDAQKNAIIERNHKLLISRYGNPDSNPFKSQSNNPYAARETIMNNPKPKYSIVIPTYNHCDDLLKPCLESIIQFSDMSQLEVIVVANGCTDHTQAYMEGMGAPFKLIWSAEPLGYTKATNLGIQAAKGEFVVLLNNDTQLLAQENNRWLDWLAEPFADPMMGITGPLELFDNYSNYHVMIFFCVMVRASLFTKIGILDEAYSPGGGEDIDFTIRANKAGYKSQVIAPTEYKQDAYTNVGVFPIWHKDNQTFKAIPEYTNHIVKRNGLLNCKRYNNDIRLNLGAGGVDYPGFLSVDMYDRRAHVNADITKIEFDDNSVSEILASHVFEHLNPYHSVPILQRWQAALKPGGKLVMEMPDIERLCRKFLDEKDYVKKLGVLNAVFGSVNTTDVGGPDEITSPHLFGWWPESLYHHLTQAGFTDIKFMEEQIPHPEANLRVECYKPCLAIDRKSLNWQEPVTYYEIFVENSYGVDKQEIRGKTVIDIGANLGMFSLLCVECGANRVVSVEAQPQVYQGLLQNVGTYKAITPLNYAAYDTDGKFVHIANQHVASRVGGDEGDLVMTMTLQTLLKTQNILGNDLVLKLDCEGAEFNILLTASNDLIRRFGIVYMEVHDRANEDPKWHDSNMIGNKMMEAGFKQVKRFTIQGKDEARGTFDLGVYVDKWVRL